MAFISYMTSFGLDVVNDKKCFEQYFQDKIVYPIVRNILGNLTPLLNGRIISCKLIREANQLVSTALGRIQNQKVMKGGSYIIPSEYFNGPRQVGGSDTSDYIRSPLPSTFQSGGGWDDVDSQGHKEYLRDLFISCAVKYFESQAMTDIIVKYRAMDKLVNILHKNVHIVMKNVREKHCENKYNSSIKKICVMDLKTTKEVLDSEMFIYLK